MKKKNLNTFLNEIIEAQKCRKDAVRYVPPQCFSIIKCTKLGAKCKFLLDFVFNPYRVNYKTNLASVCTPMRPNTKWRQPIYVYCIYNLSTPSNKNTKFIEPLYAPPMWVLFCNQSCFVKVPNQNIFLSSTDKPIPGTFMPETTGTFMPSPSTFIYWRHIPHGAKPALLCLFLIYQLKKKKKKIVVQNGVQGAFSESFIKIGLKKWLRH